MIYRIMGRLKGGRTEQIDEASTYKEAESLLAEYELAFRGQGWSLWIEK